MTAYPLGEHPDIPTTITATHQHRHIQRLEAENQWLRQQLAVLANKLDKVQRA